MKDAGQPALPGCAVLLQRALDIYRARWRTFLRIIAVGIAATLAALLTFPPILFYIVLRYSPAHSWDGFVFAASSALFLTSAIFVWTQAALVLCALDSERGPTAQECFETAWSRIPGFLWVCVLACAICFGGLSLLVLPGLVLSAWMCFAPLIYLSEGVRGFDALLKSRYYIRGRFWAVILRLSAFGAPAAASTFIPFAGGAVRLVALPFTFIGAALVLTELRRLRGTEPFAPSLRAKLFLALFLSGLLVPVLLMPRAVAWARPGWDAWKGLVARILLVTPPRPGSPVRPYRSLP
jgi:hypothetical protein